MEEPTSSAEPLPPLEDRIKAARFFAVSSIPPAARFHQKLLRAQQGARPLAPTGQFPSNAGQRLAGKPYISEQGATTELKKLLHLEGFTLTSSVVESRDLQLAGKKEGSVLFLHTARVAFTLTDSETGYSETYYQEGRQLSEDHRGPDHAMKNAAHIFIMRLLLVGMEGDEPPPRQAKARAGQHQQQQGAGPSMADGRDGRIPEARGLNFEQRPDGNWIVTNGPEAGAELDLCLKCQKYPRIQVRPGRELCISRLCGGVYIDPLLADLQQKDPEEAKADFERLTGQRQPPAPVQAADRRAKNTAEEIRLFRQTVDQMVDNGYVYDWQVDAVIQASYSLPPDIEKWGLEDWSGFVHSLKTDAPGTIRKALEVMAKRTPAGKGRVEYLATLLNRLPLPKELKLRTEADAAAQSGWHDAVQQLIEACEKKVNQGELPVGGQKAGARK